MKQNPKQLSHNKLQSLAFTGKFLPNSQIPDNSNVAYIIPEHRKR
jgi:hypothetical protein